MRFASIILVVRAKAGNNDKSYKKRCCPFMILSYCQLLNSFSSLSFVGHTFSAADSQLNSLNRQVTFCTIKESICILQSRHSE